MSVQNQAVAGLLFDVAIHTIAAPATGPPLRVKVFPIAVPEVWKEHEESFVVRPLDCDLLLLDSEEMITKCRGRYVFLDTLGYFMGVDDSSSYAAAIEFAKKINHLIKEGCLGVRPVSPAEIQQEQKGNRQRDDS